MKTGNIIVDKSYEFALKSIEISNELRKLHQFDFASQVFRSGTSIGANINEAQSAESKKDFIHKMSISLKECREIIYWLNIAKDSNFINSDFVDRILVDANELKALLTSIINKTKQNLIS